MKMAAAIKPKTTNKPGYKYFFKTEKDDGVGSNRKNSAKKRAAASPNEDQTTALFT
jgi:hypothetical protein